MFVIAAIRALCESDTQYWKQIRRKLLWRGIVKIIKFVALCVLGRYKRRWTMMASRKIGFIGDDYYMIMDNRFFRKFDVQVFTCSKARIAGAPFTENLSVFTPFCLHYGIKNWTRLKTSSSLIVTRYTFAIKKGKITIYIKTFAYRVYVFETDESFSKRNVVQFVLKLK